MSGGDTSALSALKGMVSFFTLWHLDITQREMDSMETRFHLVPVVGILFGVPLALALASIVYFGEALDVPTVLLASVACMLIVYIGSKFIHFDGLTDFGDGMIVSGKREDHVRALKDTLVGAGGIGVAMAVVLTSFAVYSIWGALLLILVAPLVEVFVKNAMVFAASFGIAGNGMAGRQVSKTTPVSAAKGAVVSVVCGLALFAFSSLFYCHFTGLSLESMLVPAASAIVAGIAASAIVGCLMARNANRVFGMVNGDILGATNEVCRPVAAFVTGLVLTLVIRWRPS
ncbi:MAG: adenosylcobinamide-GDP ribazoletransferase [Candidatus Methanomethylophilaceae archaeon]|nr:adenosylcobinamide-GDP ribazoletransferase [Candidatus Methanomethylophilaceae archaeon]